MNITDKRISSLILVLVLCVSLFPASAFADEEFCPFEEPDPTENISVAAEPYYPGTEESLPVAEEVSDYSEESEVILDEQIDEQSPQEDSILLLDKQSFLLFEENETYDSSLKTYAWSCLNDNDFAEWVLLEEHEDYIFGLVLAENEEYMSLIERISSIEDENLQSFIDNYLSTSRNTLEVSEESVFLGAGISDNQAPVVSDFTINDFKQTYTPDDIVLFSCVITDESGVKSARVTIKTPSNDYESASLENGENDQYIGRYSFDNSSVDGEYQILWIEVYDIYDNSQLINLTDSFLLSGDLSDNEAPVISNFDITDAKRTFTPDETVHFSCEIIDGSGVKSAKMTIKTPASDYVYVTLEEGENNQFTGTYSFNSSSIDGEYQICWIEVYDTYNNSEYITLKDSFELSGGISDNAAPVITDFKITEMRQTLTNGDIVHFSCVITDESGVNSAELTLAAPSNGYRYVHLNRSHDNVFTGTYCFTDTDVNGEYNAHYITVRDIHGNHAYIDVSGSVRLNVYEIKTEIAGAGSIVAKRNNVSVSFASEDDTVAVSYNVGKGFVLSENGIVVKKASEGSVIELADDGTFFMPNEDVIIYAVFEEDASYFELPYKLSDFSVDRNTFKYGETVKLKFKVTGAAANIVETYLGSSDGNDWYGASAEKSSSGYYECSFYIRNTYESGDWQLKLISVMDTNYNQFEFYNSDIYESGTEHTYIDMSAGNFTVTGTPGENEWQISDFSLNKTFFKYGETVKLKFRVTGAAANIVEAYLGPSGGNDWYGASAKKNSSGYYECSFYIRNTYESGDWQLKLISVMDTNYNQFEFYNSDIYESGTEHTYIDMTAGNFTVTGTPPACKYIVSDISVGKSAYLRGETVQLKFKVTGATANFVEAYLGPSDGNDWYGASAKKNSSGYYECSFYIRNTYESGDWQLKLISVMDTNYNQFEFYNSDTYEADTNRTYIDMSSAYFQVYESYIVQFDGNGNTTGSMSDCSFESGVTGNLPNNGFGKTGCTFQGWNTRPDGTGEHYQDCASVRNLAGPSVKYVVVLYAEWLPSVYSISYELNGGINSPANPDGYSINDEPLNFSDPIREGYTFSGWFKDKTFKTKITHINEGTTGNLTVYAKWTGNTDKYLIVFNGNGSTSGSMKNQINLAIGKTYTLAANTYKKTGYSFVGWQDDNGIKYKDRDKVSDLDLQGNAVELCAVWEANPYSVSFNGNGGIYLPDGSKKAVSAYTQSMTYGVTSTLNSNLFSKTGYSFVGWNTKANGTGTAYNNGADVLNLSSAKNGKVVLYAQWNANTYAIRFSGECISLANLKGVYNKALTLPVLNSSNYGHYFKGWQCSSDGKIYKNKASVKNLTAIKDETVIMTAVWEAAIYNVSFNLNGGKYTADKTTFAQQNNLSFEESRLQIPDAAPTLSGYRFTGWNTKDDGTGIHFDCGEVYNLDAQKNKQTISLYAEWEYTLKLDGNGDEIYYYPPQVLCRNESLVLPKTGPARKGYSFLGWNSDPAKATAGSVQYKPGASVKNLGEKTLYAVWKINTYKVTYVLGGGSNSRTNPSGYKITDSDIELHDPSRNGYVFCGWYLDSACTIPISRIEKDSCEQVTLYAKWGKEYIVNTNTGKFHIPTCRSVKQMSESNKAKYVGSRNDLFFQGYSPCKICNP